MQVEAKHTSDGKATYAVVSMFPYITKAGVYHRVTKFTIHQTQLLDNSLYATKSFKNASVLKDGSGFWYKINVPKDGIYKIDKAFLESCGISTTGLNPNSINIFGNGEGVLPESNAVYRSDDLVKNAINDPEFYHAPLTSLVSIENTTNKGGGACYDISELKKIKERLDKQHTNKNKFIYFNDINDRVKKLKLKGKDSAGDRQVGAWQSSRTTPYSAINEAEKISMARINVLSEQDMKKLNDAKAMIDQYQQELKNFENGVWKKFINKFKD